MDPRILRETGELSDFTVYVEKDRFKLHKFPLFTKSEYFKELVGNNHVCELKDLPGGAKTFSIVADYCYEKDIDINVYNVAFIFACAEFLRMKGRNNLLDKCRNRMRSICLDAQNKGCLAPLVIVLCCANEIKDDKVVNFSDTLEILLALWRSESCASQDPTESEINKVPTSTGCVVKPDLVEDYMVYLPLDVVAQIIKSTGFNCKSSYRLISKYLGRILDHQVSNHKSSPESCSTQKNPYFEDTASFRDSHIIPEKICQPTSMVNMGDQLLLESFHKNDAKLRESLQKPTEHFEVVFVLVPEENSLCEYVSPEWIKQALILLYNTDPKPKCYRKVLRLAHKMLLQLRDTDVTALPSQLMRDLVTAFDPAPHSTNQPETPSRSRRTSNIPSGSGGPSEQGGTDGEESKGNNTMGSEATDVNLEQSMVQLPSEATLFMLQYMDKKAEENSLTEDDFFAFFKKMDLPKTDKKSQDMLLNILLKLHEAGQSMTEQHMKEVLSKLDLSLCSMDGLERALKSNLLPSKPIAEAAIKAYRNNRLISQQEFFTPNLDSKPQTIYMGPEKPPIKNKSKRLYGKHLASDSALSPWSQPYAYAVPCGYQSVYTSSVSPSVQSTHRPSASLRGTPLHHTAYSDSCSTTLDKYSASPSPLRSTNCSGLSGLQLLDIFEEETSRELAEVPSRAHLRTIQRSYTPVSALHI